MQYAVAIAPRFRAVLGLWSVVPPCGKWGVGDWDSDIGIGMGNHVMHIAYIRHYSE
jgi:hypothetical protein